jgi:hypothetical protein
MRNNLHQVSFVLTKSKKKSTQFNLPFMFFSPSQEDVIPPSIVTEFVHLSANREPVRANRFAVLSRIGSRKFVLKFVENGEPNEPMLKSVYIRAHGSFWVIDYGRFWILSYGSWRLWLWKLLVMEFFFWFGLETEV